MWFYLKCYKINIYSVLFNYGVWLFCCLIGFACCFFLLHRWKLVCSKVENTSIFHTVFSLLISIVFYGPQKPHRSVVSLLQIGCIQHWLGQQNLAFRFHVSGQRTLSSSSVKVPLFTDCYQHILSEGIHTNSHCSFISSLFYTSCIYFKHSPHWNLWRVTE